MTIDIYAFVVVSVLLIICILLQQKNSNIGALMGGDSGEEIAQTRRGPERFFHAMTILLSVLLFGIALYSMFF